MKKILIVLSICLLLCGCKKNDNELVMVTEAGFAPYEYYENGEIVGVDVEIANEIAKNLNKTLVIKDIYFDSIINELKSGKADFAIAGISITEERKKEVDFSNEYITSRQVVIVNNDSNIISINEINNKIIAVQLGSVADSYVTKKKITENIVRQKKYLSMIEDLKANKVDLIIMDELPAKEILKNNSGLKILDGYIFEDSYAVAVKKGNTELLNKINEVIAELKKNNKIDEYILRYSK
ncbi:MAG: ABC transporter substrate-binding protein [Bacilli bacterium]